MLVTRHPVRAIVALLILLIPLNLAVLKTGQNFDFLGDLGSSVESHAGFDTMAAHFGRGNALPNTLVIKAPSNLRNDAGLRQLDSLDARLAGLAGVSSVQGPTRPGGQPIPYQAFARNPQIAAAMAAYLSADGHVAQLSLTTSSDPYSAQARSLLKVVRGMAQIAFPAAQVQTTGTSPEVTDIQSVMSGDLARLAVLVLGGIFLVLVLLLRALVAPILSSADRASEPGRHDRRHHDRLPGNRRARRPHLLGAVPDPDHVDRPVDRLQYPAGEPGTRGDTAGP